MFYKIIIYFLLFIFFFSCSPGKKENNKTVFRYNESAGITSLDPVFAKDQANIWLTNQIFNGLVQFDDNLKIIPCIAKSWKISDDGLTYTFYLRNDVFFHDNKSFKNGKVRKVVASDFVFSFKRIIDNKITSPGAWVFNNVDKENNPFTAINDSVFQIKLKQLFPPFLGLLTMQYCSVVPKEAVEFYGNDFRSNPVGTGPFMFKMWEEGEKLVLLKNPNYFEFDGNQRLPYLDAISVTFIIDKQISFLEFIKGNLDFISGIESSYKDELLTKTGELNPKYKDKFYVLSQPYLNTEYLAFLFSGDESNPLQNKAIRQAINYGFDRNKMITYLRNNIGTPGLYGFVPLGMPYFDTKKINGYDYNPEKSKQLLREAGFPNGEGLSEIALSTNNSYLELCKYIQSQLSEVGIKIKIDVNPPATHRNMVANSKLLFFRGSWIADYADAENYLSLFYSKNFSPAGPNTTHFSDKIFDELFEKAQKEINDSLRNKYYEEMDNIVMQEAAVVVLYYDQVLRFVQNNISGLNCNPMNLLGLKRVKKTNN
ncbi:MAG: ABC transporter substrate-binding protein [Bacteroidales bacterium]|nr:ABC transporter substrate-binding protein [Bacteroidales bacterium]